MCDPLFLRPGRRGFSLIELMVVLAIMGVLAALAIPAYSSYVSRARLSEALSQAASYKTLVLENVSAGRPFNQGLNDDGSEYLKVGTANVRSVRIIATTGAIGVDTSDVPGQGTFYLIPYTGADKAKAPLRPGVSPPGNISWLCVGDGWAQVGNDFYKGTLSPGVTPASCRAPAP
ncbi:pilin [Amphibiibacter pelophylacis]|uniref:Pilin n=1 Tax=Amphibiibacter pelophylacis TaxID=1799477 RepID=A0ACC6P2M4_9BURK